MFKEMLFMKKAYKIIAPSVKVSDMQPSDAIVVKILLLAYQLKKDKKFKYLNNNKICLYDTCLFVAYVVRWIYFNMKFLTINKKDEFDCDIISKLSIGFSDLFKCKEIENSSVNVSRFRYYDEAVEDYYLENDKNDIMPAFEEFRIIIKSDIINKSFKEFNSDSPLYLLSSTEESFLCDVEFKYALHMATESFKTEIAKLIQ